jgi:hypothetical protein
MGGLRVAFGKECGAGCRESATCFRIDGKYQPAIVNCMKTNEQELANSARLFGSHVSRVVAPKNSVEHYFAM